MNWAAVLYTIIDIAVYSLAGILLLGVGTALVFALAPFPVRREIGDEQNRALAVLLGAMVLGVALVIAAVMFSPPGLPSLWSEKTAAPAVARAVEHSDEKVKKDVEKKAPAPEPEKKI